MAEEVAPELRRLPVVESGSTAWEVTPSGDEVEGTADRASSDGAAYPLPVIVEMPIASPEDVQLGPADEGRGPAPQSPQPGVLITGPDGSPLIPIPSVQTPDTASAEPVIVEMPALEAHSAAGPALWEPSQVGLPTPVDHAKEPAAEPGTPSKQESGPPEAPRAEAAVVEEVEEAAPTPAAALGGRYAIEHWNPTANEQSGARAYEEPNEADAAPAVIRLPELEAGSPPHVTNGPAEKREAVAEPTASPSRATLGTIRGLPDVPATDSPPVPAAPPEPVRDLQRGGGPTTIAPPARTDTTGAPPEPRSEPPRPAIARPEPPRRVDGLLLHATQARDHVQQGFGAANRGMLYTARQEFLQALRVVAEAKDARSGRRTHMDALSAGLTAIEEAEQIRNVSSAVAETDLSLWVATHKTQVMQGQDVSETLPLAIIDRYHEYAAQQLGAAVAGDPSGSMALYGLARIFEHLGSENGADRVARSRQSVALHEAALLAHPENHLAAHELGVVLTKLGRTGSAVAMLTRSVQLSPSSTAYHNLAVASRQMGRHQQAAQAERFAAQIAERERATGETSSRVAWLEPTAFARTSDRTAVARPAVPADREASAPPTADAQQDQKADKGSSWWKLPAWR